MGYGVNTDPALVANQIKEWSGKSLSICYTNKQFAEFIFLDRKIIIARQDMVWPPVYTCAIIDDIVPKENDILNLADINKELNRFFETNKYLLARMRYANDSWVCAMKNGNADTMYEFLSLLNMVEYIKTITIKSVLNIHTQSQLF